MIRSIEGNCPGCKASIRVTDGNPKCSACGKTFSLPAAEFSWEHCPLCECPHFYLQRDFNTALGCAIMLVAIGLVPWSYGLSLPVAALIDWLLYRRVPQLAVCYRCHARCRGWALPAHIGEYSHHTAVSYDE